MTSPLAFRWTGDSFEPLPRSKRECDVSFVVGQVYALAEEAERSSAQHRFFFASVRDAWANLPEDMASDYPSPEHLRKRALCMTGWADERTFVASSPAEATRLAAFMKPTDEFAVIEVRDCVVRVWTAKSQSLRAMNKADFRRSCDDVLHYVSGLIGARPEDLGRAA